MRTQVKANSKAGAFTPLPYCSNRPIFCPVDLAQPRGFPLSGAARQFAPALRRGEPRSPLSLASLASSPQGKSQGGALLSWLPLRGELSRRPAAVTERGVRAAFPNHPVDLLTDRRKLSVDFPVAESENEESCLPQRLVPNLIFRPFGVLIMLGTVELNHQLRRCAIEIHNIRLHDFLFIEFYGVTTEEQIPKLALVGRHLFSEPARIRQEAVIVICAHLLPLSAPVCALGHLSPRGRGKEVAWFSVCALGHLSPRGRGKEVAWFSVCALGRSSPRGEARIMETRPLSVTS